jgi:hypothetical protein
MSEPVLDGSPATNVYGEHTYKPRVTFGAGTVSTIRGNHEIAVTRPTETTLLLTFPKAYAELTEFHVGRAAAASVAGLEWIITDNSIATDGTVTLTSIESDSGTATAPAEDDVAYITISASCDVLEDRYTSETE